MDGFKDDPFKDQDPFGGSDSAAADPFQNEDPFKDSKCSMLSFTWIIWFEVHTCLQSIQDC